MASMVLHCNYISILHRFRDIINQHTKSEMPSFTGDKDMVGAKFKKTGKNDDGVSLSSQDQHWIFDLHWRLSLQPFPRYHCEHRNWRRGHVTTHVSTPLVARAGWFVTTDNITGTRRQRTRDSELPDRTSQLESRNVIQTAHACVVLVNLIVYNFYF